jgi:hypothetical protein
VAPPSAAPASMLAAMSAAVIAVGVSYKYFMSMGPSKKWAQVGRRHA